MNPIKFREDEDMATSGRRFFRLAALAALCIPALVSAEECQPHGFGCKSCVADGVWGALWVNADCSRRCDKVCGSEKATSTRELPNFVRVAKATEPRELPWAKAKAAR
jgi:hypothetical protein